MPEVHALLSASGAHRWLECPPSARLEEKLPSTTSTYAEEGTFAHELAAHIATYFLGLISEADYENKLEELKKNEFYSYDMHEHCVAYAKLIVEKRDKLIKLSKNHEATVMIEAQIKYDEWAPEGFGTADCLILSDGYLEVVDFKYGKGKRVDAFGNPQMRMYTLGAYQTYGLVYNVENITMTIFQPRLTNGITSDDITINELLEWGNNYVKPRALLAFAGQGDFNPSSETCKFCKAKAACRARAEENLKLFDDSPDTLLLTPDETGEILAKADDIENWLKELKEHVQQTLLNGEPVKGWKIIQGRSIRKYADPIKVADAMIAAGYDEAMLYKPKELIGITQMEKDFGKKNVAAVLGDLLIKPPGKPTLAVIDDPRPEYKPEEELLKEFDK